MKIEVYCRRSGVKNAPHESDEEVGHKDEGAEARGSAGNEGITVLGSGYIK